MNFFLNLTIICEFFLGMGYVKAGHCYRKFYICAEVGKKFLYLYPQKKDFIHIKIKDYGRKKY
ncbi:hypothetical protein FACS189451_08070 [Bacteroidia bacterium]|nr:hypothetical protein FACS189446_6580 [Bacteroidia bacterium]GHT62813.1 hypothetical protein FACS189451_08070 [Bacteroidia bacterium]